MNRDLENVLALENTAGNRLPQLPPLRAYRLWVIAPDGPQAGTVVQEVIMAHAISIQGDGTLMFHIAVPHPRGMEVLTVRGYSQGHWIRFVEEQVLQAPVEGSVN